AEYIKMPEDNLFVDKSGLNPKYLSVLEPLGNAVHTVLHFNPVLKTVVVIGCGPIGLMGIDVLKAVGAKKIIAIETQEIRMNLARDLGADVVIDGINEDVVKRVLEETNNEGVDLVCEFSGNSQALSLSLDYIKNGGNISLLGIFKDNVNLDINKVVFKGLNIYGVTGRSMYESWQQIDSLLKTKKLHLDKVVTHQLDFNQMDEAFKIMEDKRCGKIVLSIKE
ncbi:MAG: zinc-binding dehydrogenase, partial [Bacilli bacterium]